ncbi:high-affinity Zn(2+) transporter zrt1 [Mortierella alpina]|nr:high-affinity Zn(2+) transporter zrt1 [Mortierella alpina]
MSECREQPATEVSYSRHLHLAGVIVILAASTLGVFMPVIATRFHSLRIPSHVLTLGKQFGTGVILATAFIHMLPTAMSNLSSPCLGPTFSQNYQSLGGLLALSASLVMHWIEFMAMEHTQARMLEAANARGLTKEQSERIHLDLGGLGATGVAAAPCPGQTRTVQEETPCRRSSCSSVSSCRLDHHDLSDDDEESRMILSPSHGSADEGSLITQGPRLSQATSYGTIARDSTQPRNTHDSQHHHRQASSASRNGRHHHHVLEVGHSHAHGLELLDVSQRRISTYILEAGVASHSIVIGVALGVSSDAEFTGLLVALVFHQFFEGFALGARIAELDFESTMNHYLLALVFSLTTPIGAALGIVISSSYDPRSVAALLTEGILDAISTGILLYMGYVNLLAVEFNLSGEIRRESNKIKAMCFLALWMGVAVMAIIGIYA